MIMSGAKRKKSGAEPQNIKRWRSEIESYTGQEDGREEKQVPKKVKPLTRKEKRKEGRQLKKMRQNAFQQHQELPTHKSLSDDRDSRLKAFEKQKKRKEKRKRNRTNKREKLEAQTEEEAAKQRILDEETAKDDKMIKQLEKQMKMTKRKSKTLPQSFQNDGLDFILDVLDPENLKTVMDEDNDDDDDLPGPLLDSGSDADSDEEVEEMKESSDESEGLETAEAVPEVTSTASEDVKGILRNGLNSNSKEKKVQFCEVEEKEYEKEPPLNKKVPMKKKDVLDFIRKTIDEVKSGSKKKTVHVQEEESDLEDDLENDSDITSDLVPSDEVDSDEENKAEEEEGSDGDSDDDGVEDTEEKLEEELEDGKSDVNDDWEEDAEGGGPNLKEKKETSKYKEDIYGRLVDKKGNVVMATKAVGAYVPPGRRLQMASSQDEKKKMELEKLKKQLKGLINRLSESNIQPISTQIEEMYRSRSRAELSELLTSIIIEACVSSTLIPERLISEQMMLLAILMGNVGNEVGAVFLQGLAEQFSSRYEDQDNYGQGKEMDNLLVMLANMYNFKMFHSVLIFDILKKFADSFRERDIELLLVLLKNVGFSLRKDDPVALKEIIIKVQDKAGSVDTKQFEDESRVKFMLEVLMAIRNNNMRKIPNYDPSHVEHLRKLLRNYTKGTTASDTQLRISLEDLLNADARGRWWLVGSAWTGRDAARAEVAEKTDTSVTNTYSDHILELARQQRMNTDIRRNIFCIIMTSEDFADAFEKLLRLNLKNQQEREIIHVVVDISLQEKSPNPFYSYLTQKFCEFHRRFQMTVQFNFWDRLKILSELTPTNINNLAAFMTHLIATKAISISVLKVVEFSELDKHKLQLVRLILRALLLDQQDHVITDVFSRVAPFPKLAALREALRMFMKHFLLRRVKGPEERTALEQRIEVAERALGSAEGSMQF